MAVELTRPNSSNLQNHYAKSRQHDEKVVIEWENLEYSIVQPDAKKSTILKKVYEEKKILKNLNGRAESGQLLAIMGPTGKAQLVQLTSLLS